VATGNCTKNNQTRKSMNGEQFKNIRTYLTNKRYLDQKWSQVAMGDELLNSKTSVFNWESGSVPVPARIAKRMKELFADCALEQVSGVLKEKLMQADSPDEIDMLIQWIKEL